MESAVESAVRNPVESPPSGAVLPIDCSSGLFLDSKQARKAGEEKSAEYCFAAPFPHAVFDGFLPDAVARLALNNFPANALSSDRVFDMGYAGLHKRQILPEECSAPVRQLFHFFNSQPMLEFLEGLTTIRGLIPDPYFVGGGFHETGRGGKLGIHADFRINEQLHLHRRLNVILYLNENWKPEWGGALELWDRDMKAKLREVMPVFNRCVVFNTDADSFHGHPDPLALPRACSGARSRSTTTPRPKRSTTRSRARRPCTTPGRATMRRCAGKPGVCASINMFASGCRRSFSDTSGPSDAG